MFKKWFALIPVVIVALLCTSCTYYSVESVYSDDETETESVTAIESDSAKDAEIIEAVIAEFMPITAIPHATHNEKALSDYLVGWAKDRGLQVQQDDYNNVIIDVPATEGYEDAPYTGLQCHMDMVMAVDEGYDFDPEKDGLTIIRDDETLTAEHTSLGADDGIGIATALYLIDNCDTHGPLRLIITTDEEDTQTGAKGLDPSILEEIRYLINLDSEVSDELTIGSAAAINMLLTRNVTAEQSSGDAAYELAVTGSAGGHSALEINNGRVNSIVALCDLLYLLDSGDVDYRLAYAQSGNARNAIPVSAKAVIVANSDDEEKIEEIVNNYADILKNTYSISNPDIDCNVIEAAEITAETLSKADTDALIALVQNTLSGVHSMSQKRENTVESSNNIGILEADTDGITLKCLARSSEEGPELHIINSIVNLGTILGFDAEYEKLLDAWPEDTDNILAEKAVAIYSLQNGEEPKVVATHAGLEAGVFCTKNPDMDIISIGPDAPDVHTTKEAIVLSSIPKVVKWVDALLKELKE